MQKQMSPPLYCINMVTFHTEQPLASGKLGHGYQKLIHLRFCHWSPHSTLKAINEIRMAILWKQGTLLYIATPCNLVIYVMEIKSGYV